MAEGTGAGHALEPVGALDKPVARHVVVDVVVDLAATRIGLACEHVEAVASKRFVEVVEKVHDVDLPRLVVEVLGRRNPTA
jgi:hypothetical protein